MQPQPSKVAKSMVLTGVLMLIVGAVLIRHSAQETKSVSGMEALEGRTTMDEQKDWDASSLVAPQGWTGKSDQAVACGSKNVALNKPTGQMSTGSGGVSSRGVDGNMNQDYFKLSCTHTTQSQNPWWYVDIGSGEEVCAVKIFNRQDCCASRLKNFKVFVTNRQPSGNNFVVLASELCHYDTSLSVFSEVDVQCMQPIKGKYVGVQIMGMEYLTLCEFEVFTTGNRCRSVQSNLVPIYSYFRPRYVQHVYTRHLSSVYAAIRTGKAVSPHPTTPAFYVSSQPGPELEPLYTYYKVIRSGLTGYMLSIASRAPAGYTNHGVVGYVATKPICGAIPLNQWYLPTVQDYYLRLINVFPSPGIVQRRGILCYVWGKSPNGPNAEGISLKE